MSKEISSTTELRTGSNWRLEPTFSVWQKMSYFEGVSREKLAKLGMIIDLGDKKSAVDLPLEEELLCKVWSDIVSGLIPDMIYSVADLESQLRLAIAFILVIYGCLADKLGDDEGFATHKEAIC